MPDMNNLKLITLFTIFIYANGSKVVIQIESDDILKLIENFIKSKGFRDVETEIVQRSVDKRRPYNNPYHPEDDKINDSMEVEIKGIQIKDAKTNQNDINIERDNENYILEGGHKSEDELDSNGETERPTKENTFKSITPTTTAVNNVYYDESINSQNFRSRQKRFKLKRS